MRFVATFVTAVIGWALPCVRAAAEEAPHAPVPEIAVRESRPRLLITPEDLPRLRIRCGIPSARGHPLARSGEIEFGTHADDFERLKRFADASLAQEPLPGSLYAPALMHLLTGEPGKADPYTAYVTRHLARQLRFGVGRDDAIVALDWCFDALPPGERSLITTNLIASLKPFRARDTLFDHMSFQGRLCSLAGALVLDGMPSLRPVHATRIRKVVAAGALFLEERLVRILNERGAMATSPAAAEENADACFAVEVWRTATGRDLWPRLRASLGRCCEPYFWTRTGYSVPDHGFLHDEGTVSPAAPGMRGRGFTPAVPLVVAARTKDSVAAWFARAPRGADQALLFERDRHVWMKILYHEPQTPAALRIVCPLGRDLGGGWVTMRSAWGPGAVIVLFDAGQPFLRARQHFDAGQFQIFRQGLLARDAGDGVSFDAITAKGGAAYVNREPADWDLFARATIAHNCITVYDPAQTTIRRGRQWPAVGNQRVLKSDYSGGEPIAESARATGHLLAFETNLAYSYAATDLAAAYPDDRVLKYTRQVLLLNLGLVLVCDRIETAKPTQIKTWHLQLPNRPGVDGADLPDRRRVRGTEKAGVWQYEGTNQTLASDDLDGRLFVRTLEPAEVVWRVIGGPKKPRTVPEGRHRGTRYFGGEPDGYEHRLLPAHVAGGGNAYYRLGKPTRLGEQFGLGAVWGRLDVQASSERAAACFVHLLVPSDGGTDTMPETTWQADGVTGVLSGTMSRQQFRVEIALTGPLTGRVTLTDEISGQTVFETPLATKVKPAAPIPTTP